jgi:uncharacterized heparinase superfamily protein
MRRSQQIVLSGAVADDAVVKWGLRREGRRGPA